MLNMYIREKYPLRPFCKELKKTSATNLVNETLNKEQDRMIIKGLSD